MWISFTLGPLCLCEEGVLYPLARILLGLVMAKRKSLPLSARNATRVFKQFAVKEY
jgi:hypothetical protein